MNYMFVRTFIVLHSPHDSSDDGSYTSLFTEWLKQCSKLKKITYVPFKNYLIMECTKSMCSCLVYYNSLTFNVPFLI